MSDALNNRREGLIIQQAGHDPTAFHTLYELYFRRVYSYVAAKVNDQLDAEDLVSDIFLQVMKALPQFKNQHHFSFAAWVFTIARNAVTDFYRRQGRTVDELQWDTLQNNEADGVEFDTLLIEQERVAELSIMLNLLPERRREVMLLKYFSGLRNMEIAQILGLDERTVASHISRGLKDLYDAYAKKLKTGEGTVHEESR